MTHALPPSEDPPPPAARSMQPQIAIVSDTQPDHELAAQLADLLQQSGLVGVTLLCRSGLGTALRERPTNTALLLVFLTNSTKPITQQAEIADLFAQHHLTWLRADPHCAKNEVEIGPVFSPYTPCFRCFSTLHPSPPHDAIPNTEPVAAAFLALIALRILSRIDTHESIKRYDATNWTHREFFSASIPGCTGCSTEASPASQTIPLAILYEQAMACRSPGPVGTETQREYEARSRALTRQSKSLPAFRQIRLPRAPVRLPGHTLELLRRPPPTSNPPLNLAQLDSVVKFTCGLRQIGTSRQTPRRWAASVGNLGSVELFILTRGLADLSAGLYFYQPATHALAAIELRAGPLDVDRAMRLILPTAPEAEAAILFTSAFARLEQKYGPFAYKLSQLDAGAALAQLHFVARIFGLWSDTAATWPDDLVQTLCGLEDFAEQVTSVVALSRTHVTLDPQPQANTPAILECPADPARLTPQELLQLLYRQSRTSIPTLHLPPRAPAAEAAEQAPPLSITPRSPAAVLLHRRTVRTFHPLPVALDQVSNLLHVASTADSNDGLTNSALVAPLEILVAARRVNGLSPFMYRFDPVPHALVPLGPLPTAIEERAILRGDSFTGAAVFFWICGDLEAACRTEGTFGHRRLLLRAGATANRLWLAAIALGLEGGIVAGLQPGPYGRKLGINGVTRASLVGFVAGAADSANATRSKSPQTTR